MDEVEVDSRLLDSSFEVINLPLSKVLLKDNSHFPWLILVPRRANIKEIIDLSKEDRYLLIDEIGHVSQVMQEIYLPDKLNFAALGNVVPQLHVHIIARYTNDIAFPNPVFNAEKKSYGIEERRLILQNLVATFGKVR